MNRKAVLFASIFLVLALNFTLSPVQAISPLLPHTMIFRGQVEAGYVGGGSPIIRPADGMVSVIARDNPMGNDKAKLTAFCDMSDDNLQLSIQLVSLHTADPVRFYEDYMILWGFFDVYVNGTLLYNHESGYFSFNWVGGFWGLLVGTPVTNVLAYVSGSDIWYNIR